tara:strand:+ start:199 stop:1017 length:819 start_codon:yes stop_codon:yes gene_type:complete
MKKRTVWNDHNIKMRVIDKYYMVIEELLVELQKLLNTINDIDISSCMYIAINSIHRVFEYVLIKTKNIEKAFYYAQKTYFYYIEYMEQIHRSNLQNTLNQTDAVLFIYKKTIFEIQTGKDSKIFDTITNIMTLEDEITDLNNKEYQEWLLKLSKLVNIFFYWENSNIDFNERIVLSNCLLKKYLIEIDNIDNIYNLEFLQQKMEITYENYHTLLIEYLEYEKKNEMQEKDSLYESEQTFLLKFYTEKSELYENIEKNDMKGIIRWMYQPITF